MSPTLANEIVYKYKVAIHYLTQAVEMGYYDAALELAKAHYSLAEFYYSHGGSELSEKFKKRSNSDVVI